MRTNSLEARQPVVSNDALEIAGHGVTNCSSRVHASCPASFHAILGRLWSRMGVMCLCNEATTVGGVREIMGMNL